MLCADTMTLGHETAGHLKNETKQHEPYDSVRCNIIQLESDSDWIMLQRVKGGATVGAVQWGQKYMSVPLNLAEQEHFHGPCRVLPPQLKMCGAATATGR